MGIQDRSKRILANFSLLLTGAIWGGGFVVMKNALDTIPVNYLLAFRFLIGALGLSFSLLNKKHKISRALVGHSAIVGLLLYASFAVQTYGLALTSAGKSAMITAVYVILVPIFGWALYKKRPAGRILFAACLMLAGVALVSWDGANDGVNAGDMLTLLCGVLYAVEIMAVDRFGEGVDVFQFSCLQFAFASAIAFLGAGLVEDFPRVWTADMYGALAYCGLASTLIAMTLMNIGIKYASPDYASLFMSTESAFGCLFGVLFLQEGMSAMMLLGCLIILAALTISQIDFGKRKRENGIQRI